MAKKLSPNQQNLLAAMARGVVVHYMGGPNAYCFRSDTMRSCTKTVHALLDRQLIMYTGSWKRDITITAAGIAAAEEARPHA